MNSELEREGLAFDAVWGRIRRLTGWNKYSQLAEFLKIKAPSIAGAKNRGFIAVDWVFKVAQGYNASTDWLATGEGPMMRGEVVESPRSVPEVAEGYVQVPRYEIAASAGGGAMVHSEQIVDFMTFRAEWMRVTLGLMPSQAAVISVIGDSMEPYLADGDLVLIDLSVARIENDSIYVLQAGDSLLIKRIQKKLDGTVIITSDNARYQPEIFQGDLAERLRVVGRLVRRLVR